MATTGQTWTFDTDGQWHRRGRTPRSPGLPNAPTTPWLPFELPERNTLLASARKVLPHYFVTFPLGGDGAANSSTWFDNRNPSFPISGSAVRATDGDWDLRDKPVDLFPRPRASAGGVDWKVLDKKWEIQQAIAAGFDGFFPDWLNLNDGTGDNRTGQIRELLDAAVQADPTGRFKIALMIDGNTSIARNTNLATLIVKAASLAAHPACMRLPDGRLVLAVYMPEGAVLATHDATAADVLAHFTALRDGLVNGYGIDVAYVFCAQRGPWYGSAAGQGYGAALNPITWMHSRWGSRNPDEALNSSAQNAGAAAYQRANFPGKLWMQPVSVQDNRPNQNKYEEARAFANVRATWQVAIEQGADWIQIPTWSDMAEHAHIYPSRNHGWVWLDLCSYYLTRYKLGVWPTVAREAVYLAHRIHRTSGFTEQVTVPDQVRSGSTAAADLVEAFVFLTSTANTKLEITVNGVTTSFDPTPATAAYGGPGLYSITVPLPITAAAGAITAQIRRNDVVVAQVASQVAVTSTPIVQDMHYRCVSSLR